MTDTDSAVQHSWSADSLRAYADRVAPGWHVAHKPEGRAVLAAASKRRGSRSTSFM